MGERRGGAAGCDSEGLEGGGGDDGVAAVALDEVFGAGGGVEQGPADGAEDQRVLWCVHFMFFVKLSRINFLLVFLTGDFVKLSCFQQYLIL